MKYLLALALLLAACVPLPPPGERQESKSVPAGVTLGGSVGSYVGSTRQ